MEKLKAAAAGGSKPSSPAVTPASVPASAPITTRRDIEQNTYTSERSERLRQGNLTQR
jgi:hypothetical protein